jgi:integrase/recombinase XerD
MKVSIYVYRKTNKGWRYVRAKTNKNGHLAATQGPFFLRCQEKWIKVGTSAMQAEKAKRELLAKHELGLFDDQRQVNPTQNHKSEALQDVVEDYLAEYGLTHAPRSLQAITAALNEFVSFVGNKTLNLVVRLDVLKFGEHCKRKGSERTANNKFLRVHQFLKAKGVNIVSGKDAPRYDEAVPEVFTDEELEKFFDACDETEHLLFSFLLQSMMRDKEFQVLEYTDIDYINGTVTVRSKEKYGFKTKTRRDRVISISDDLVKRVTVKRVRDIDQHGLIFPARSGGPNKKLLRLCKTIAKRAGLDPDEFWLHKFRATGATKTLQAGFDVATVQRQLGHSDIASTMRYLAPARAASLREKVNQVWV